MGRSIVARARTAFAAARPALAAARDVIHSDFSAGNILVDGRAYYGVWNLSWALDTPDEEQVLHAAAVVGFT